MKITKITVQKRDPTRVNLYIDGKFAFGTRLEDILKDHLSAGQEITPPEYSHLFEESESGKLFEGAVRLLSFRPRSEVEILRFLTRKKAGQGSINNVLSRLKRLGQINDLKFARWFVEQRKLFKPKGATAIKSELERLGVDRTVIDQVVRPDGRSEEDIAFALAEKRLLTVRNRYQDSRKIKQNLQAFLARRGFSYKTAYAAIARLFKKE